jgi:hypothetical protein
LTDPTNLIANAVSTIAILVGVYSIVNRTEDRINRRSDQRFDALEKLFTEKLLRVEQVMDARIKHLEENN